MTMLSELRVGQCSPSTLTAIRATANRTTFAGDSIEPTRLMSKNDKVDATNTAKLNGLQAEERTFHADDVNLPSESASGCRLPAILRLKVGAQVMLVRNIPSDNLCNGSRGVVTGFAALTGHPLVHFAGKPHAMTVDRWQWLSSSAASAVSAASAASAAMAMVTASASSSSSADYGHGGASRTQYPLILAWALTIHKSQALTIDRAVIDLAEVFGCGMTYVAMSRVRSLANVCVVGFAANAVIAHPKAVQWYHALDPINATRATGTPLAQTSPMLMRSAPSRPVPALASASASTLVSASPVVVAAAYGLPPVAHAPALVSPSPNSVPIASTVTARRTQWQANTNGTLSKSNLQFSQPLSTRGVSQHPPPQPPPHPPQHPPTATATAPSSAATATATATTVAAAPAAPGKNSIFVRKRQRLGMACSWRGLGLLAPARDCLCRYRFCSTTT